MKYKIYAYHYFARFRGNEKTDHKGVEVDGLYHCLEKIITGEEYEALRVFIRDHVCKFLECETEEIPSKDIMIENLNPLGVDCGG